MLRTFKIKHLAIIFAGIFCAAPSSAHKIQYITWKDAPPLSGFAQNQTTIFEGGFSGITIHRVMGNKIILSAVTDRGPNGKIIDEHTNLGKNIRPFLIPEYNPKIIQFEIDTLEQTIKTLDTILIKNKNGMPITGLPPVNEPSTQPDKTKSRREFETAVNAKLEPIQQSKIVNFKNKKNISDLKSQIGLDTEGLCQNDGAFWVSDEYGPSLVELNAKGAILKTYNPGNGLPEIFEQVKINRGIEGLTCFNNKLFFMIQSPLSSSNFTNKSFIRLAEFDLKKRKVSAIYAYPVSRPKADTKIGDLTAITSDKFYVVEKVDEPGESPTHKIFEIQIGEATNLLQLHKNPEEMAKNETTDLIALNKKEVFDLTTAGLAQEKVEGIATLPGRKLLIVIDNDFGLDGAPDYANGVFPINPNKNTRFGLIELIDKANK